MRDETINHDNQRNQLQEKQTKSHSQLVSAVCTSLTQAMTAIITAHKQKKGKTNFHSLLSTFSKPLALSFLLKLALESFEKRGT